MRITAGLIGLVLLGAAAGASLAQQPVPDHQITISDADLGLIWEALSDRPWKQVNGVMDRIRQQMLAEQARRAKPPTETPTEPK